MTSNTHRCRRRVQNGELPTRRRSIIHKGPSTPLQGTPGLTPRHWNSQTWVTGLQTLWTNFNSGISFRTADTTLLLTTRTRVWWLWCHYCRGPARLVPAVPTSLWSLCVTELFFKKAQQHLLQHFIRQQMKIHPVIRTHPPAYKAFYFSDKFVCQEFLEKIQIFSFAGSEFFLAGFSRSISG